MRQLGKAEKLHRLLSDLQQSLDEGAVAVVEGPNDARALRALGVSGNVVQLSKMPISELAEVLSGKSRKAVILTDFDDYGEHAMEKLRDALTNECVAADTSFRERFKKLLGHTEFEDVPTLLENELKSDTDGKNIHRHDKIHGQGNARHRRHC